MSYTTKATGYIAKSLTGGESLIYQGRVSVWSLLPLMLLGTAFVLMAVGQQELAWLIWFGIYFFVLAAIRYFTTELGITNKRVIAKTGLIKRDTIEINIHKIESIRVNQGILGRILNYGSIVIAGAGNPYAPIPGISNPLNFRKACLEGQSE